MTEEYENSGYINIAMVILKQIADTSAAYSKGDPNFSSHVKALEMILSYLNDDKFDANYEKINEEQNKQIEKWNKEYEGVDEGTSEYNESRQEAMKIEVEASKKKLVELMRLAGRKGLLTTGGAVVTDND